MWQNGVFKILSFSIFETGLFRSVARDRVSYACESYNLVIFNTKIKIKNSFFNEMNE